LLCLPSKQRQARTGRFLRSTDPFGQTFWSVFRARRPI